MSGRLLFLVSVLLSAGCNEAEPGAPDASVADANPQVADAETRYEYHVNVGPSGVFELTAVLARGTKLTMSYQAAATLSWTLHAHEGSGTAVLQEGTGPAGETSFTSEASGTYFLQWNNAGDAPSSLDAFVTLRGEGRVGL